MSGHQLREQKSDQAIRSIRTGGRVDPVVVGSAAELGDALAGVLRDGDLLLMMGAGDIGAAAQSIARNGFGGGDA